MNIPIELFSTFNDVKFDDLEHKYTYNNQKLLSITTLLHKYEEEFENEYWAEIKANQFGCKKETFMKGWEVFNNIATYKGSLVHSYAEFLFNNKLFPYPHADVIEEFGYDALYEQYLVSKSHIDKFYNDCFGKLIPIRTEMVVYDKELLVGGMMDILFYNVRENEIQIWDYKTNADFEFNSKNKLKYALKLLEASDLNIYSLQLGCYKKIIERNIPNIKLGKSYLIWVSHKNPSYQLIQTKNMDFYVDLLFNTRKEELELLK